MPSGVEGPLAAATEAARGAAAVAEPVCDGAVTGRPCSSRPLGFLQVACGDQPIDALAARSLVPIPCRQQQSRCA